MSDLISRSKFISVLEYLEKHSLTGKMYISNAIYLLENQPNAYDVDKVVEELEKEVMKAVRSIETAMMFDAYDAFATATGSLTGNLAVSNYSEASLISLCETVTAYNQGRKAVIIGTPVALKNVLPTNANYRYLLDDEYVRLGHLQTFNGKIYLSEIA